MTPLTVKDANELDGKIPRDLIIMYQGKPYITQPGLLWKAFSLYGGNNFGITTEIIEKSTDYCLAKATLKTKDGMEFSDYGEASKANVGNPQMHRYMIHLAITRARCRALRAATGCGYVSSAEMSWGGEDGDTTGDHKVIPMSPNDDKEATVQQRVTIESLAKSKGIEIPVVKNQREAKEAIATLVQKG